MRKRISICIGLFYSLLLFNKAGEDESEDNDGDGGESAHGLHEEFSGSFLFIVHKKREGLVAEDVAHDGSGECKEGKEADGGKKFVVGMRSELAANVEHGGNEGDVGCGS